MGRLLVIIIVVVMLVVILSSGTALYVNINNVRDAASGGNVLDPGPGGAKVVINVIPSNVSVDDGDS